jgi:hypothetical protein
MPALSRVGPPGIGWLVTAALAAVLADTVVETVAVGEPAWLDALGDADAGEAVPDAADFEWQAVAAIARTPIAAIAAPRRPLRCDRRATRSAPSVLSNICGQP